MVRRSMSLSASMARFRFSNCSSEGFGPSYSYMFILTSVSISGTTFRLSYQSQNRSSKRSVSSLLTSSGSSDRASVYLLTATLKGEPALSFPSKRSYACKSLFARACAPASGRAARMTDSETFGLA